MEFFNSTLNQILSVQEKTTIVRDDLISNLYRKGHDEVITVYTLKRWVPPEIKIYYPISDRDQFPPVPVSYRTDKSVSPSDLLRSIWTFYEQILSPENIQAYYAVDPTMRDYLTENSRLLTVMMSRIVIRGLTPYQDGFLLELTK